MADMEQQLVVAIAENRIDDVKNLIEAGVDVDHRTPDRWLTVLGQALRAGNAEVVRLLLDAGACPHTIAGAFEDRIPPIHIAAQENRVDLLALLLQAGAFPESLRDRGDTTVLMCAASHGNLPMVDMLLAYGCDVNKKDSYGTNVLYYARCRAEDVALWQRLLDAGADPHGSGSEHRTLLHDAAQGASGEIVKLLLAAGVSIKELGYKKSNALIAAVLNGDPEVGEEPEGDQWVDVVKALVEAGVDVTHRDEYGKNALQHAIEVRSYREHWHGEECEASQRVVALIQAEFDRRKAAALSVLPKHMLPELGRLVLELALLMEGTPEKEPQGDVS